MESELIKIRKQKIEELRQNSINPYPYNYARSHKTSNLIQSYSNLKAGDQTNDYVNIAGRIMSIRNLGKLSFLDLQDGYGKVQLLVKNDIPLVKYLDIGDHIGSYGNVFKTKKGELTINAGDLIMLCKSLRPLPEKWHGLKDPDLIYRNRSDYFATSLEVRKKFEIRSKAIQALKDFLNEREFLEVEIPILQPVYGGASARPFKTFLNALGKEYYLSISPELYLKRLIAGGFERVYTVCKNFRNEGIDHSHNPEFTMMECYWSYADYNDMMNLTEELYESIFLKALGTTEVMYKISDNIEAKINFKKPWTRVSMLELVTLDTGINVSNLNIDGLRKTIEEKLYPEFEITLPKSELEKWCWGELVVALFEHYSQNKLIQPTFVIDHPKETTPLCKIHRKDSRLIERFEPFVAGMEIGNAYSELNDPIEQRRLFEEQADKRELGDELAHQLDEDFLKAIELGIPPTGGLGLGIDRMVMLLIGYNNIKDVLLFPLMK